VRAVLKAARPTGPGRVSLWAPVLAYMALIFSLSSMSSIQLPQTGSDKLAHVLAYMVLSVLFVRALAGGLPTRIDLEVALIAIGATIAYGVTDEWHQMFVAGRFPDRADVLADAIGAVIGASGCWAWGTIQARRDV
jgi:VanZ family protein